jgi:hypothetical protein
VAALELPRAEPSGAARWLLLPHSQRLTQGDEPQRRSCSSHQLLDEERWLRGGAPQGPRSPLLLSGRWTSSFLHVTLA